MSEYDLVAQGNDTQLKLVADDHQAHSERRVKDESTSIEDNMISEGANMDALPQLAMKTGAFNTSGRREVRDGQERPIQATELRERGHFAVDNGVVAFVDPTSGDRFMMQYSDYFIDVLKAAGYTEGPVYVPKVSARLPTITRQVQ